MVWCIGVLHGDVRAGAGDVLGGGGYLFGTLAA